MFVSFIIPHYNLPIKELHRCLDSIVAQGITPDDYEIILVDDGSKEPPIWSKKAAALPNKKLIIAEHAGPGAARNIGLNEAKGEYVQFIDADDALAPDSLPGCLEAIRSHKADILQHNYMICPPGFTPQNRAAKRSKTKIYESGAEFMLRNNLNGSPCAYLFKREIAEKHHIRFTEKVLHEDEDFNTKIHYHGGKLIQTNRTVYHYHIRPGSITSSTDPLHELRRISDLFALLERVVKFRFDEQERCTPLQRKALNRKITMLTVDTLLNLYYNNYSAEEIEELCETRLTSLGLYPLPWATYSTKYIIFRLLANSTTGIKILRAMLPSQKPQKR
ncbi:MAG: glycosyltransferase family 2 protein [Bacteroidaceae bacterium]|nr:glycosyltransferase family 2 protein [Bacteroidaceae bacterium]